MSDDTGSTAPRRPAPDPFYLAVADELGLDREQIIDGSMRVGWIDDPMTWKGRTGLVEVTWQGRAHISEETHNRLRQTTREETDDLPTYSPTERPTRSPGSLAPDRTVGPDETPYVDLPILTRCAHCSTPLTELSTYTASTGDGDIHHPLCHACATSPAGITCRSWPRT